MFIATAIQLKYVLAGPSKLTSINGSKEMGRGAMGFRSGSDAYHASSDATLFSSSLPVLPHEKCMHQFLHLDHIPRFIWKDI